MRQNCHLFSGVQQDSANETFRGVRAFPEGKWNFGITWLWIQLAISRICRDLPAEISAPSGIFSFNQRKVSIRFSQVLYPCLYTHRQPHTYINVYFYFSLSLLSCCSTTPILTSGNAILSYWPPHHHKNIKAHTNFKATEQTTNLLRAMLLLPLKLVLCSPLCTCDLLIFFSVFYSCRVANIERISELSTTISNLIQNNKLFFSSSKGELNKKEWKWNQNRPDVSVLNHLAGSELPPALILQQSNLGIHHHYLVI